MILLESETFGDLKREIVYVLYLLVESLKKYFLVLVKQQYEKEI